MNITHDEKFIYINGIKMAVLIKTPESYTLQAYFLSIIDDVDSIGECKNCGWDASDD